ncbi:MAG: 50S ribosomal protein L15 [Trueperaceae bacterium]|nr:50S ribosomal protein L15 [Trueperaceae bacterium]
MKLNELKPAAGSKKTRRRVGRGLGSGRGKTAGRGQKGQSSRSGFSQGAGWEGGRSRLIMRLPKRGFTRVQVPVQIVNVGDLGGFEEGTPIDVETLVAVGLVRHLTRPVKLLAGGVLEVRGLQIEVDACSAAAARAVADLGGSVTVASAEEAEAEPAVAAATEAASSSEAASSGEAASSVQADEPGTTESA